jgi:hypothetical protein
LGSPNVHGDSYCYPNTISYPEQNTTPIGANEDQKPHESPWKTAKIDGFGFIYISNTGYNFP